MIFYESKSNLLSCWQANSLTFPPHIHKEIELLLVTKGEMELTVNSTQHLLKKGDIAFSFPNAIHGYRTLTESQCSTIIFNSELLPLHKTIFSSYRATESFIPSSRVSKEVYSCLTRIFKEVQSGNKQGIITGYLYVVVTRLLSLLNVTKIDKEVSGELIERILGYIQQNYLNAINLNTISAHLNISPFYLSRVFSNNIGLRLDAYINELRVNYANHLLVSTDKPITEIALESGFETLRTFNRAYRNFTALSPREYRRINKGSGLIHF